MPSDGRYLVEKPFGETAWSVGKPAPRAAGGRPSRNRRGLPRYPIRLAALVDHGKVGGRAMALDVGRGGARLEFTGPLLPLAKVGQAVRFRMNLRPRPGPIELHATVAWVEGDDSRAEVGIVFRDTWLVDESPLVELLEMLGRTGSIG